mmetsp:Transcript_5375/g.6884  ORF Transcript_5375/g.6884 Transcript_5375/m.6884 type:complete len:397 (+) Transcript_5375:73-1263(+)
MSSITTIQDRSLLILIVDVTPSTWGRRTHLRKISEQRGKTGPATLNEALSATLSFLLAFASCHRDNAVVIIGVAGSEVGVLYPRKDSLESMISGNMEDEGGCRVDVTKLREGLLFGVQELAFRFSTKLNDELAKLKASNDATHEETMNRRTGAAIAAATSLALCIINRFMVAVGANDQTDSDSLLRRKEDDGILSMISSGNIDGSSKKNNAHEKRMAHRRARGMPSPRIMIIQASEDNTLDYNAFMNCVFCANKNDVVIDGCFLPISQRDTSTFLEQACDRTGGVYSTPRAKAQLDGGLTTVLMTLFLPTLAIRRNLNMTKVSKVDFRARCFETGASLDVGMVCNLCLSIFKNEPKDGFCLTCGAKIIIPGTSSSQKDDEQTDDDQSSKKRARVET